jgi:hypothetical protein
MMETKGEMIQKTPRVERGGTVARELFQQQPTPSFEEQDDTGEQLRTYELFTTGG